MFRDKSEKESILRLWRMTSRGRLQFELGGLSFAIQKGFTPEEYARHLWSQGAKTWIRNNSPSAEKYLLKEVEALRCFYPEIVFEIIEAEEKRAELVFTKECLGGWGEDPWRLAKSFNLSKKDICAYCHEAFSIWAQQLDMIADIGPDQDGICRLRVIKA